MTLKKRVAMNKIRHTKHRLVKSPVYTGGVSIPSVFNFSKKKVRSYQLIFITLKVMGMSMMEKSKMVNLKEKVYINLIKK